MQSFLDVLALSSDALLDGLMITVWVSGIAVAAGIALGAAFGLALTYGSAVVSVPVRVAVDIVRGTPVLVLILACFYMPAGIGLSPGPLTAGAFALAVFCAAHVGETLRGALIAIPLAQTDAASAIGLTFGQTLVHVLVPQAVRQIAPNLVNTAVEIVKASSLLSAIGVGELLLTTQESIGRSYKTMEIYALAGGLYLAVNLVIAMGGSWLERRYRLR